LIVWLDYTDAKRRSQFQEAVQTLVRLKHGDIFRITFNANPETLSGGDSWKKAGAKSPGEHRANQLREQIREYMPTDITSIPEAEVPQVLARCMALAANAAEAQQTALRISPVLITSYRDGSRMVTATCAVSEDGHADVFPPPQFSRWRFACDGWEDIRSIFAPILSTREQQRLDARLHRGAKQMLAALKFLPSEDRKKSLDALASYREFHRYYPSFRHVED
jgi:hypothetical protein